MLPNPDRRNDVTKTMQRILRDAGIERGVHAIGSSKANSPKARVVGKAIGLVLADEMVDSHYVLVDGFDGKLYYAEINRKGLEKK